MMSPMQLGRSFLQAGMPGLYVHRQTCTLTLCYSVFEVTARVRLSGQFLFVNLHNTSTGSRKRSLEEDEDFGAMQVTAAQMS